MSQDKENNSSPQQEQEDNNNDVEIEEIKNESPNLSQQQLDNNNQEDQLQYHEECSRHNASFAQGNQNVNYFSLSLEKKQEHIKNEYRKFLDDSGISVAFEIIFNEIIGKKIQKEEIFKYASNRLKEIGAMVNNISSPNQKYSSKK